MAGTNFDCTTNPLPHLTDFAREFWLAPSHPQSEARQPAATWRYSAFSSCTGNFLRLLCSDNSTINIVPSVIVLVSVYYCIQELLRM